MYQITLFNRLTILVVMVCASTCLAVEQPTFTTVFEHGQDGFPEYRIPSIICTNNGTLLAFCEGRKTLSDHAQNDMVCKRSTDRGKTWSKLIVVHEDGDNVLVNPCAVVLTSGRVLMQYQRFPAGYHARAIGKRIKQLEPGITGKNISTTLVVFSDDHGKTWSRPKDVTAGTKRKAPIISTAAGPGVGIVLQHGKHKGRIIMPTNEGWYEGKKRFFNVYACFSDDQGKTWHYGNPAPNGSKGNANEVQMVELSDGSVMLNSRSNAGNRLRKVAVSKDGGVNWSPLVNEKQHPESQCMGTIIRYNFSKNGKNRILFANPGNQKGRKGGTVKLSYDDGKTWPISKMIYPQGYAYSCLTKLNDGSIGLLFEADGYKRIVFARLTLDWLTDGKDQGH